MEDGRRGKRQTEGETRNEEAPDEVHRNGAQSQQDPGSPDDANPCLAEQSEVKRVRFTPWSWNSETKAIAELIRQLLYHRPVRVCGEPAQRVTRGWVTRFRRDAQPALARVYLGKKEDRLQLFVVDQPWERVLFRELELPDGRIDAVTREQVGQIVLTTTEALLAGELIGQPREELVPPEPEPTPEPVPEPSPEAKPVADPVVSGLGLGARYALRMQAPDLPLIHEPALRIRWLRVGGASAVSLGATLAYSAPSQLASRQATVRTQAGRLTLEAGLDVPDDRALRVEATVGAGIEATFAQTELPADSTLQARGTSTRWRFVATASLGVRIVPASTWSVVIGIDAVSYATDVRYVIDGLEGDEPVADPWLVRPAAWAAFEVVL